VSDLRRWAAPTGTLLAFAVAAFSISACGGGSGGSTASTTSTSSTSPPGDAAYHLGHEATASQAKPVEAAFHAYMGALAAGEWGKACSYLTMTAQRRKANSARLLGAKSASCPAGLEATTETLLSSQRVALAGAETSAVRIDGDSAVVLYDAGSTEAAMPARREGGKWKVGGSLPSFPSSRQSATKHRSHEGDSK